MVREVAIFTCKSDQFKEAVRLLESFAAFKRTRPGCRNAAVNPMLQDRSLPYLDPRSVLAYAEYDDLKCLSETNRALQDHFRLHRQPLQDCILGHPVYGVFEG